MRDDLAAPRGAAAAADPCGLARREAGAVPPAGIGLSERRLAKGACGRLLAKSVPRMEIKFSARIHSEWPMC